MMQAVSDKPTTHRFSLLVTTFFFLSGMSGLIYEILWTRMTVTIIGGAPFAVSIVLTVFMAGLGVGSYLASRTIDKIKEPIRLIRLYGILELVIGLYGVAIPLLLSFCRPLYSLLYNNLFDQFFLYNFLTFLGCALLFGLPVICMGATLPILCRFYVTSLSHVGTNSGRLYGLNTIGAAVGALLCGFLLLEWLGLWGSLGVAVTINSTLGLVCIWVGRKKRAEKGPELKAKEMPPEKSERTIQPSGLIIKSALWVFAVSGFCAMAYEVIWTKLLALIVGPITYSFTIVLVTFITGLALGSMLFGWIVDRVKNPIWLLIATQTSAALIALLVSQLMGNSQLFFAKILYLSQDDFALRSLYKGITLFIFMIWPTLCLGATFPIVNKIYARSLQAIGRSVGFAYSINTIGAVLGSFSAGFLLVPLFGKESGLSIVIVLQLATSLIIALVLFLRERQTIIKLALAALPALIGIWLAFVYPNWDHRLLSEGKYHRVNDIKDAIQATGWFDALTKGRSILNEVETGQLLYYGDGIGGFTTVLKYTYPLGDSYISMANSGKVDASTRGDMKTQTLLTHFPMIFHPDPKAVVVIGLASGITAGEALLYPIERLDVIEINREVVEGSHYFKPWNYDVLSDPRTNLIIQDGRAHLGLTDQNYDVIISEPSNPWVAGLAALFTEEYFEYAKQRLNENGIIAQFIHSYQMDWESFALVGRTFAKIFPNSILVSTAPSTLGPDYLLIGINGNGKLDRKVARSNLQYVQESTNLTLTDSDLFYRLILSENLTELFKEGHINSDARPYLEFSAPRLIYNVDTKIWSTIKNNSELSDTTKAVQLSLISSINSQIDFAAYAISVFSPFAEMVDLKQADSSQAERYNRLMDNYFYNHSENYEIFKDEQLKNRWRRVQIESISKRLLSLSDQALSLSYLGDLQLKLGNYNEAIVNYKKSLVINPDAAIVHSNLGVAFNKQGLISTAMDEFSKALLVDPAFVDAHRNIGYALSSRGKLKEALSHFEKALKLQPENPISHYDMGLTLAQLSEIEPAVIHFRKAIEIWPEFAQAHCNLAIGLSLLNRNDEAVQHFEIALKLEPGMEQARLGLQKLQLK